MRIGFIGVGDMAAYMVEGLYRDGQNADVVLSPRGRAKSSALAGRYGCRIAQDNQEVVDLSDLVVLAVRPADVGSALADLAFRSRQVVVSVVAGATLADLAPASPAVAVRSMPVSCAAIGESPTAIFPDNPMARSLYERIGSVVVLSDEALFDAASVMGAYHGWVFAVVKAGTDWLVDQGIPEEAARKLAAGMARGAASVAMAYPDRPLAETLESLTTPGGITEAGFFEMETKAGLAAWPAACAAALRHMAPDD